MNNSGLKRMGRYMSLLLRLIVARRERRRSIAAVNRPGRSSDRGVNLIEVIVAIGVTSVGILALMSVFITGTRSNQHGEDLSRATYYARKITETIRQDNLAFTQGGATPTVPPPADTGLNDADGQFFPLNYRGAGGLGPTELGQVQLAQINANGTLRLVAGNPVPVAADEKFQRNIQITRASTDATAYNFDVLVMNVTIRWQGGKAGDGMRRVKITSMLRQSGETI